MIDPGLTVWFTGLSGAGKTTISEAVAAELSARGLQGLLNQIVFAPTKQTRDPAKLYFFKEYCTN